MSQALRRYPSVDATAYYSIGRFYLSLLSPACLLRVVRGPLSGPFFRLRHLHRPPQRRASGPQPPTPRECIPAVSFPWRCRWMVDLPVCALVCGDSWRSPSSHRDLLAALSCSHRPLMLTCWPVRCRRVLVCSLSSRGHRRPTSPDRFVLGAAHSPGRRPPAASSAPALRLRSSAPSLRLHEPCRHLPPMPPRPPR